MIRRFTDLPVRNKIVTCFTAPLFLVCGFIFIYFPAQQKEKVTRALQDKAENTANLLAIGISTALEEGQYGLVARMFDSIKADSSLVYVQVLDEMGQELVAHNPDDAKIPVELLVRGERVESDGVLHSAVVLAGEERSLGRLNLGVSLADRDRELTRIRYAGFGISVGIFFLGLLLALYLSRLITQPLQDVVEIIEDVGKNADYDHLIEQRSADEVGILIGAFNKMIVQIRDRTRELEETNLELHAANEKIERATTAKSAFLANMSHELRTPLNAILGFSQLMARDGSLPEAQKENLDVIGRSGEHLLSLINGVLEMSKIEAGKTTLTEAPLDLFSMLETTETMLALRANEKGLQLIFERTDDVPRYIATDEAKLRQVVINLVGNALKFTEEGGITVRIGCEPLDEPVEKVGESPGDTILLRFEVADTGAGIAEEDLDGLFEAFTQTASGRASQEGTGLGLPISRRFVELMGGEMTVQSEVDKGSVFKFTVRAHPAGAEDVVATGVTRRVIRVAPGQPEFRILVVEDRVENRRLLTRLLLSVGFEVRDAANGAQALERWEQWNPDFIWMDMRMPVMDGYEATRRIKESKKGQTTAVVALTASAFEEEQASILEAGCDDLVRKPFREAEVFEAMARHLGVEYEYEGAEEEGVQLDPSGSVSAGLARQDELWISKLRDASTQADASQVITLAAKIAEDDPELASYLVKLTEDFNFHVILNMLDS